MIKKGLGRGLSALIPEADNEMEGQKAHEISVRQISRNPYQPRKYFDDEKMKELVMSIREHGVIQPVLVRKSGSDYELVAGERRFRAAQLAGLDQIPAVVKELKDTEMLEYAMIENLQREDLNPLEEAEAYKRLIDEFQFTQDNLAKRIGKSRPVITNTMRLLKLAEEVQQYLREGKLTAGHARALVSLDNHEIQKRVAAKILSENLTVRDTENIMSRLSQKANTEEPEKEELLKKREVKIDPQILDVEEKLCRALGTRVRIKDKKNKGKIEIEYYSHGELERIIEKLF